MIQKILTVHNLNSYLKIVIEPIIKSSKAIRNGRNLSSIKLRPREVVGLFLVCTVARYLTDEDWTIGSDPEGRDGVINCKSGPKEGDSFATEQVYIPNFEIGDLADLVVSRISNKSSKGDNYGKDLNLIIYCDKMGKLDHQKIKQKIVDNNIFASYWLIAKNSPNKWSYFVACIKTTTDPVMAYEVVIDDDFQGWNVKKLGRL